MKNFFKNLFSKPEPKPVEQLKPKKPRNSRKPKVVTEEPKQLSPKELATQNGEPYINVIGMEIDPDDPHSGAFTFDYNDKFIVNLVKAGYKLKPTDSDQMLVDRWFQNVCRNIALEMYEQEVADPDKRALENLRIIRRRDIGDGRSEIS